MSRRFALVLLTLLFPLTLGAQRADTTMVPRELAAALIAFSDYSGLPEIVVGRVPAGHVSPLVPRGAAVLGGVTYGGRRDGGRSTTVLSMMETPDSAFALVQAQIERAGWKLAPLPDMRGGEGFVAIGATMPGRMVTYCSDSASVYTSIVEGANRGSIVRLMSTPSLRNTMCDPDRRRFARESRAPPVDPRRRRDDRAFRSAAGGAGLEARQSRERR